MTLSYTLGVPLPTDLNVPKCALCNVQCWDETTSIFTWSYCLTSTTQCRVKIYNRTSGTKSIANVEYFIICRH